MLFRSHQVGHLEFGSFLFDFTKPSGLFDNRRFPREDEVNAGKQAAAEEEGVDPAQSLTDIGRFLSLFQDRQLAFDLFTVLEDCRLDYRIKVEYPGIRLAANRVQDEADRKSTRLNSSHKPISYAVFCLKKKNHPPPPPPLPA